MVSLMDFLREKPIRTWLEERETLIPRPKIISGLGKRAVAPIDLPAGVTRAEAVEAIAGTTWARGIAQGIADKGGLSGKSRDDFIERFSHQVAEGIVTSSYLPEITRPKGPGRPPGKGPETKPVRLGKEITREELEKTRR